MPLKHNNYAQDLNEMSMNKKVTWPEHVASFTTTFALHLFSDQQQRQSEALGRMDSARLLMYQRISDPLAGRCGAAFVVAVAVAVVVVGGVGVVAVAVVVVAVAIAAAVAIAVVAVAVVVAVVPSAI